MGTRAPENLSAHPRARNRQLNRRRAMPAPWHPEPMPHMGFRFEHHAACHPRQRINH